MMAAASFRHAPNDRDISHLTAKQLEDIYIEAAAKKQILDKIDEGVSMSVSLVLDLLGVMVVAVSETKQFAPAFKTKLLGQLFSWTTADGKQSEDAMTAFRLAFKMLTRGKGDEGWFRNASCGFKLLGGAVKRIRRGFIFALRPSSH